MLEPDTESKELMIILGYSFLIICGVPTFVHYIRLFGNRSMMTLVVRSTKFIQVTFVLSIIPITSVIWVPGNDQRLLVALAQAPIYVGCLSPFILDMCNSSHREVEMIALIVLGCTMMGMYMAMFSLRDIEIYTAKLPDNSGSDEEQSLTVSRSGTLLNCYSTLFFLYLEYFYKALADSHNRHMFFVQAMVRRPSSMEGRRRVLERLKTRKHSVHF